VGADRLNEAVRCKRRPAASRPAGPSWRGPLVLVAALLTLVTAALPQDSGWAPDDPGVPDSLSGSRVDELLRTWSDLYLSAWSDSLATAWADSVVAAWSDSTVAAGSDSVATAWSDSLASAGSGALAGLPPDLLDEGSLDGSAAGRVILITGCTLDGLDESFGHESLVSLSAAGDAQAETAPTGSDTLAVPAIRFADRTTAWMGLLGLQAQTSARATLDASASFQSRIGDQRADVAAEVQVSPRRGPGRTLMVRNLLLWDRADDGTTSRQNLLYLRWRPPLATRGWRLRVGATLDVSRSEDADIALEPGAGVTADSTLRLNYLNYERLGLRLELSRRGPFGSSLAVDLGRKSVRRGGSGSYSSGTLSANHTWFHPRGLLDLDLGVLRRDYDDPTAALGSAWESELRVRWLGTGEGWRIDAELRAQATLRDDLASLDEDALLGFTGDQLIVRSETLLRRLLAGVPERASGRGPAWEWDAGVGPVAQLIRTRGGDGDAAALGARVETELRDLQGRGNWWVDGSVEVGWRAYRDQRLDHRLAFEGFTLSLAQTDYRYCQLAIIGGGDLPWSLAWEAYASLDQEWHTIAEDDARLLSFSLTLKRLWALFGRARRPWAQPH